MRVERVTRVNEIAAYRQRKDIMRNYELLKQVYSNLLAAKEIGAWMKPMMPPNAVEAKIEKSINLIESERPELLDKPATGCDYGIGG